jgi:hypothetical protein
MSTLWVGNFSFEDELQGKNQPSAIVRRFEAELAPCLAGAAASGDMILCPESVDESFSDHLKQWGIEPPSFLSFEEVHKRANEITAIEPWGWSPVVVHIVKKLGVFPHPPFESVKPANSRQFSFQIARKLACQLDNECEIRDLTQLRKELSQKCYENGFVIKSNYGQSGRGQFMNSTQELTEQQEKWIEKKLKVDKVIFLEPKLNNVAEIGVQWDVPQEGSPTLFGISQLKSDERGQYLGSIVGFDVQAFPELEEIIHCQRLAVLEIQQLGYFGPVGIDAMIYLEQSGERKSRPLQDINARWTMGRLAIHWADRCFPNTSSSIHWVHSPTTPHPLAMKTTPDEVGGKSTRYLTWCYQVEGHDD